MHSRLSVQLTLLFTLAVVTPALAALPIHNVLVVRVEKLVDTNGDQDGQLDTNETAELTLSLTNKSFAPAKNFDIRVSMLDGRIDWIAPAVQHFVSVAAGATVTLAPIQLHVSALADRAGATVTCQNPGPSGTCSNFVVVPGGCLANANCQVSATQSFHTTLGVEVLGASAPSYLDDGVTVFAPRRFVPVPDMLVVDLDLQSSHPSQSTTTFSEQFDGSGLGTFVLANLDASIASNSASNGYRCQYSDPDYPNSNAYGDSECYLGFAAGQVPVNDWHAHTSASPDGGRAFTGTRSLHYGRHTTVAPLQDTYPLSQLDGVRTGTLLHLASRVCVSDPAPSPRACLTAADCASVGGGACEPASPELSFKQQVSLTDSRCTHAPYGTAGDRAMVAVQTNGSTIWEKIFPHSNVYDVQAADIYSNCTFDPTDDGNTESDYFAPSDPLRRLGPSSSCFPEFVFAFLGDTAAPFQATATGRASDGPGLAGSLGPGTWIESRFDLTRYRGRSIRIRFLVSTIKVSDVATLEAVFHWNPIACDDGWWIDDVKVSETLGTTLPTVTTDAIDNGALPGAADSDGDGHPDYFDCAPADGGAWAAPGEVLALRALDKVTVIWQPAPAFDGSVVSHDLVRGNLGEWPVGTGASETCLATGLAASSWIDPSPAPATGTGVWYLVRARNVCGIGIYGYDSSGGIRTSSACP